MVGNRDWGDMLGRGWGSGGGGGMKYGRGEMAGTIIGPGHAVVNHR